jgi:hypothetical protein
VFQAMGVRVAMADCHPTPPPPGELGRRPVEVDQTVVQHHDLTTQRRHVAGLMGGQYDGGVGPAVGQHLAEPEALLGVQAHRRLVEHQQLGAAEQRLRDRDPPSHATDSLADSPVANVVEPGHPSSGGLVDGPRCRSSRRIASRRTRTR